MTLFKDQELSKKLYNDIEKGNIDNAINSLIVESNNLNNHFGEWICESYTTSSNQENWYLAWGKIIKESEYVPNKYIIDTLKVSYTKRIACFLLPILNSDDENLLLATNRIFIKKLINESQHKTDFLCEIINIVPYQEKKIQNNFNYYIISQAIRDNALDVFEKLKDIYNIPECLSALDIYQKNKLSKCIAESLVNHNFAIDILNNIRDTNIKIDLTKSVFLECVENNNTQLIKDLFVSLELSLCITIFEKFMNDEKSNLIYLLNLDDTISKDLINAIFQTFKSNDEKFNFGNMLIIESYNRYNIPLFKYLLSLQSECEIIKNEKKFNQETIDAFINMDDNKARYVHTKMQKFYSPYGNIEYKDALLTIAQIRARKPYDFTPVVLDEKQNIYDDFFECLIAANRPIKQYFLTAGQHFMCGAINIDENGNAKLFLLDSLGTKDNLCFYEFLKHFTEIFTKYEIFVSEETRQHTGYSCAVFALDDLAHLPNLRIANNQDIWQYLASEKQNANLISLNIDSNPIKIYSTPLPLSLMRTMQSTKLFSECFLKKTSEIKDFKINKKNQTAEESVKPFFQKKHLNNKKLCNFRIEYKLLKMREHNWEFISKHNEAEIEEAMQYFTLNAFKKRIQPPKEEINLSLNNLNIGK